MEYKSLTQIKKKYISKCKQVEFLNIYLYGFHIEFCCLLGDTVFFHPLLIHGSGTNRSPGFRKVNNLVEKLILIDFCFLFRLFHVIMLIQRVNILNVKIVYKILFPKKLQLFFGKRLEFKMHVLK